MADFSIAFDEGQTLLTKYFPTASMFCLYLTGTHVQGSSTHTRTHTCCNDECSFYQECRNALRYLLQVKDRLCDTQALFQKAVYRVIMRGRQRQAPSLSPNTNRAFRSVSPWSSGLKYLNNDEVTLTWLVL